MVVSGQLWGSYTGHKIKLANVRFQNVAQLFELSCNNTALRGRNLKRTKEPTYLTLAKSKEL
jgi:hypothetical protein